MSSDDPSVSGASLCGALVPVSESKASQQVAEGESGPTTLESGVAITPAACCGNIDGAAEAGRGGEEKERGAGRREAEQK